MGLTSEQGRLLAFIREHIRHHGYAPTIREMMQATGMRSMQNISTALEHLEEDGYIRREARRSRALEVACARIPLAPCNFVSVGTMQ